MGRAVVISALGWRGAGAVMWLLYCWMLTRILDAGALGEVLYVLVFSSFIAALISAGWGQIVLRDGARFMQAGQTDQMTALVTDAVRGGGRRIAIMVVGLGVAYLAEILPAPVSTGRMVVITCVTAAILALILIYSAAHRACGHMVKALAGQGVVRAVLPLFLSLTLALTQPVLPISALLIHLISLCFILVWLLRGLPRDRTAGNLAKLNRQSLRDLSLGQAGFTLLMHMDVLVLGWVVGPAEAGIYLIVRRISGLLGLVFDALRNAVGPSLSVAFHRQSASETAAQVNRLFLLVGGVAAAVLVLAANAVLPLFGAGQATVVFYWLLLGGITPALFGAAGLLMSMGGLERVRLWHIASLLPVSAIVLVWASTFGIANLAMASAMLQWALGAGGAIALHMQFGIRPGALSFGQSR
ncbi:MAG: hypothetical protein COB39_07230 [Marinosulfonomonas sp.]|nr:MAG: hypothetical protein COB39_07230 [Marinosulfonomonas sp.]